MSDQIKKTLDAIQKEIPGDDGQILRAEVEAYTKTAYDQCKKHIELGGMLHGDSEKQRRRLIRACILASLTFNVKRGDQVPEYTKELQAKQAFSLLGELRTFIVRCPIKENSLWFGSSFRSPGTATLRDTCKQAFPVALSMLMEAAGDLDKATNPGESRAKYEKFFGTFDADRHQIVIANVRKIRDSMITKDLWLYYRGVTVNALKQSNDWPYLSADDMVTTGKLPVAVCGGSTLRPLDQKKFWAQRDRLQKAEDMHVKLGTQVEGQTKEVVACVIIHELSHYLCDTRDVKLPLIIHPLMEQPQFANDLSLAKAVTTTEFFVYNTGNAGKKIVPKGEVKADKTSGKPRQYNPQMFDLSYGEQTCRMLAEFKPEKAPFNADNYAWFCNQYR